MKRALQTLFLLGSCSVLFAGCSTVAEPVQPVAGMLSSLYFQDGTYEDYRNLFQTPAQVISKQEFETIQKQGSKTMFDDKSMSDVLPMLRSFQKDEQTSVVYWVDFTKDKSQDLHWTVVKTDDGWKIQN